jgi:hypothetical protein
MRSARTGTAMGRGIRNRALAMSGVIVLLTLALGAGVASADSRDHRNAENTYTKWIVGYPDMAGVVGGDVGTGTFAGEVLTRVVSGDTVTIDAIYHFNGTIHSFTAAVHVVQTGLDYGATSVITGTVTDGWLKGNQVQGAYLVIDCSEAANRHCFDGSVDVLRGTKPED